MSDILDKYYAYKFIYLLTQKWEDMPAFKLGIIDKDGNELKPRHTLTNSVERAAYTRFHKLVFSIKKMLEHLPLARSTLARYATALLMIKEDCGLLFDKQLLEIVTFELKESKEDLHKQLCVIIEDMCTTGGVDMGGAMLPLNKRNHGVDFEEDLGDDTFAGTTIFNCDADSFQNIRLGKNRYHRYSKYVGSDDQGERIRTYGRNNPKNGIVLRDEKTGAMRYLRKRKH